MPIDIDGYKDWFHILTTGLPRIIALFTVLPMLHKKVLGGAMIRNGIAMTLVIFLHPMLAELPHGEYSIWETGFMIVKEIIIGALLGFCIAIPFWALESAGFFIDNQRGSSMASTMNPLSGSETSPMGILFSQSFTAIIMTSGLFLLMLESLFKSYIFWPVDSYYPNLTSKGILFFLGQFDLIISLSMWLSAPVIIAMFITEFGIALISKSAPQLNVFILAMPIKSGVAAAILVLYIGVILNLSRKYMSEVPSIFKQLGILWQ